MAHHPESTIGRRIEDYAIVGDGKTAALISRDGSVDWLCWPRFDSPACFAALLGNSENGYWRIAPAGEYRSARNYRDGSMVLETLYETAEGSVRVIDYMPLGAGSHLARIVEGVRGTVGMRMELVIRFGYGSSVPWVVRTENGDLRAVAGPDKVTMRTQVPFRGTDHRTVADFDVGEGERMSFAMGYSASHEPDASPIEPHALLEDTQRRWTAWSSRCEGGTPWDGVLKRSLMTLKCLVYAPTGGIVAAPTTSLPEDIGGSRNWDYRFCWLRDSAFTLIAFLDAGYVEEARAWQQWLIRAVAGIPQQARILYGIAGERLVPEIEIDWLSGYENSKPVRIGNAASEQFQLDVYGEVFEAMHQGRQRGMKSSDEEWRIGNAILKFLEEAWRRPDEGIWEVRAGPRHFVHSKMMAWLCFDRAVQFAESGGIDVEAPLDRWRKVRAEIHAEICDKGFDRESNSFVQFYGSKRLDASTLLAMHIGFLPADDPRMTGTVEAVGRHLMREGFVARYETTGESIDGLTGGEGAFLPCSFWYVDNLIAQGRHGEAKEMIDRLIGIANDVGLLAEEYDVKLGRMLGNFPQAFSHVAMVNTILRYARSVDSKSKTPDACSQAARYRSTRNDAACLR